MVIKNYKIHIIASLSNTRALGRHGKLLFPISEDLKRFKVLTTGHPIIMGRKTFESIGRALPDRTNIVVTRNTEFHAENTLVTHTLEEAFERAEDFDSDVFVIGGEQLYIDALPSADVLHLTLVDSNADGDVHFPEYGDQFTKETYREEKEDPKSNLKYVWLDLEKQES